VERSSDVSEASSTEGFEDGKDLEPEELLRRARSRLLEDLATETNVQKTVLPLPHALDKYKSVRSCRFLFGLGCCLFVCLID